MRSPAAARARRVAGWIRYAVLALLLVPLASPALELSPAQREFLQAHPVLKVVSDPDWAPIEFVDGRGRASGLSRDLLDRLGRDLGVRFESQPVADWNAALRQVADGKADLFSALGRTPERDRTLAFTAPYLRFRSAVVMPAGSAPVADFAEIADRRFALVEGYGETAMALADHPQLKHLLVPSVQAALEAVASGRVDATLGNPAVLDYRIRESGLTQLRVVGYSSRREYNMQFAVRPPLAPLAGILDAALAAIPEQEMIELRRRWFELPAMGESAGGDASNLGLSAEERAFLKQHPVIRLGADPAWPPIEFVDERGRHAGLAADLLQAILKPLGLRTELVPGNWADAVENLRLRRIDLLAATPKLRELEDSALFSRPYLEIPFVLASRQDAPYDSLADLRERRIAVVRSYSESERLRQMLPQAELLKVDTLDQALTAVSTGKADATVVNIAAYTWQTNRLGLNNLRYRGLDDFDIDDAGFGVRKDWPLLASAIEKSYAALPEPDKAAIRARWFDPTSAGVSRSRVVLPLSEAERAKLAQHPVLRLVADPQAPPISFIDASGNYVGLVPDYLARMADLLGLRLQHVPTQAWAETLKRFEAGEADLIAPLALTPERLARYRYSDPLVSFRSVVMARREQPVVARLEELRGLRFAQIAGSNESQRLKQRHPELKVQDYGGFAEALQAVSSGQADAILSNPAVLSYQTRRALINNLHVVAPSDEPARVHHLAVAPDQAWLLPLLNRAFAAIPEPEKNEIRRRWLDEDLRASQPQVLLTPEESDWVAAHGVLRLGYSPSAPISFRNSEGVASGQAVELVNEICKRAGLRPEWVYYEDWPAALAALERREVDALGSVSAAAMANGDPVTLGYMPLQNGLFLRQDAPYASSLEMLGDQAVVAAVSTSSALTALRKRYPHQKVLELASPEEQLDALRSGKADAAVGNLALLEYLMRQKQIRDLRVAGLFDSPAESKLAVRADHPLTVSVLNKAVASIGQEERQAILNRWFSIEAQQGFAPTQVLRWALTVLLPVLAGLIFLGYWALRLRREVRARKFAEHAMLEAQRQLAAVHAQTRGQFQAILDNAPMAIWAKDRKGAYIQANQAYEQLFGVNGASSVGCTDQDLYRDEDAQRFRNEDEAVLASGETRRQMDRTGPARRDGDSAGGLIDRRILKIKFPIRDDQGRVFAVGGVALDVTEQEQLREELEQRNQALALREEQLLRLSSSTAVDDGDLRETYRLVTEAAATSLGVQRASVWYLDEAREHIVCQWLHDSERGNSAEPVKLARASFPAYFEAIAAERILAAHDARRDPRTVEFTDSYLVPLGIHSMLDVAIRHHGQTIGVICCEHTGTPLRWSEEDSSFVGALADLVARALTASERRRADDGLRELNASLEQTVAARTAQARSAERLAQERADKVEAVQQRLRRITDASPGALYQFRRSVDGQYSFPFMSAGIEELIGIDWRLATQDAARVFATVYPDDLPGLIASVEASAKTMTPYVYVFRVARPGAGTRWIQARSRPSRDEDGGITWDGFLADVTESREQAMLVELAQQRLLRITDSIAGLVFEYRRKADGSHSAPFVSNGVEQLIGVPREAVLENVDNYFAVVLPEDAADYAADIQRSADRNTEHRHTFRIRHAKTGEVRWLFTIARAPQRENGELIWRGYVIDVTEQKQLEAALGEARDEANEASKAKSEFLANMSHEIRTPMNAIIGLSHLALQTELSPRQHDYLNKIHNSAQSLLGIINDILDLSKIEAGKLSVEKTPFDLFEVLDQLAGLISVRAQDKGLEFLISTTPELPYFLVGDALRLGQVLLNLSGNAVKFTAKGQVLLSIRELPGTRDAESVQLRFEVTDTGIGMSAEQQGRLFQAFSQADASTTRKYGGTGLGLAICKQLVELMGGEIGVESQPGQGSTFWFSLRLGLAADQRRAGSSSVPLQARRALVVDDNASARDIVEAYLSSFGMQVAKAATGAEAVQWVRAAVDGGEPCELVVMDWQMPGMNGIEAARAIRQLDRPPKIILLTAHGREEVARQAELEHLDGFLVKPVNPSLLLDTSMQVLLGQTMAGGGARRPRRLGAQQAEALLGLRVLLAEDNEINQQVAREVIEGYGATVEIADNGRIAVDKLREGGIYDLVLMDMQMPEMDGLSATRAIRADASLPRLPIIAMTANAMEADRQACLDAGMDDFISKPFRPAELLRLLRLWGRGEQSEVEAEPPPLALPAPREPQVFDRADGIDRVGSEAVLLRLATQLFAQRPPAVQAIAECLAAGARGEAQRLAHSLAGSAGLLGFERLSSRARQLEQALRAGDTGAEWLAPLEQDYREAEAAQAEVRRVAASAAPVAAADYDPALLEALESQILAFDSQATETLDQLRRALAASAPPLLAELDRLLMVYDFETAAEQLPALREALRGSGG